MTLTFEICPHVNQEITNCRGGGGGETPFLPMEKCVFSHFFLMGKNGEKSIWKEREMNTFPFRSIYIFSHFSPMGKNGKTHNFPRAIMGLDPPNYTVLVNIKPLAHLIRNGKCENSTSYPKVVFARYVKYTVFTFHLELKTSDFTQLIVYITKEGERK